MFSFFLRPYPFLFELKRNLVIAIFVGLLVGGISYFIADEKVIKDFLIIPSLVLSGYYGLITFFSIIFTFQIIPSLFISEKTKDNWNIGKEFLQITGLLSIIVLLNFCLLLLVAKDFDTIFSINIFLNIGVSTLVIGLIPSAFVIWVNYTIILKENLNEVKKHNSKLKEVLDSHVAGKSVVKIPSDSINEEISFDVSTLLFVKSEGNYVEVYTEIDNLVKKSVHRASLQTVENYLQDYSTVVRSHRSYLVNCINIKHSTGTARNYQLYFEGLSESIPVSRNQFQHFNLVLNNIKPIQNK